ncbi:MAG: hypothetical protein IJ165_07460 [Proteobacteria bacterium]|nr:hypothetical protein [Pseudomonadota bacterium]
MRQNFFFGSIFLALTVSSNAWADDAAPEAETPEHVNDCTTLDTNTTWRAKFAEFTETFKAQDYDKALKITEELQAICADSPVLNYSIGMTYRSMGDNKSALKYLKKATQNTDTFRVDNDLMTRMYYAQYEVENIDKLSNNNDNSEIITCDDIDVENFQKRNKILMWTGVGMMGAGLAMLGGLGITSDYTFVNQSDITPKGDSNCSNKELNGVCYTESNDKPISAKGWAIAGAGIGLAIAGAFLTGFTGYYYTHPDKVKKDEKVSFNYNIGPTSVGFGMTF